MPCSCNGYDIGPSEHQINHSSALAEKMCKLCNLLAQKGLMEDIKTELPVIYAWWLEHQEIDQRKREEELKRERIKKAKEEALAKLSEYEKQLLNIYPR